MGRQSVEKTRIKDPKKRDAWVEQLLPYFIQNGIKATPIDEVVSILGKSKATVYKHFESHHEIVSLVIARKLNDLKHFVPILGDSSKAYQERYVLAVAYISKHLGDVSNVFLSDLKEIYPDLWNLINSFKLLALNELRTFYISGIQDGTFEDINPDLMVLSDELFFDALTNPEYLTSKGLNLKAAFESYFKMRFNGILKRG
ncbi:MAG: TetR/AcrR family transcriptional regulator [Flavobacteriales bacterium]|nr:TetR/AcrR family transcriptional regulator [Flavobacteriales bacterium]